MIIILSIEESVNQIIGGFPEYIILSTNVPSTIFYTLDGTDPDESSEMFVDRIIMPTDGLTRTLKAIAYSGSITSAILEETYFTTTEDLNKSRLLGKEGISILPVGAVIIDSRSFDGEGNAAQETTIPFVDLDLVASTTNNIGEPILKGTSIDFINFSLEQPLIQPPIISSPNDNLNFDPKAAYIIIDGTTPEAIANQSVRIINRPHGTMDLHSRIHSQNQAGYQLLSGNFVRHMVNPRTGIATFYYRESRENRWIKSTQKIEGSGALEISSNSGGPPASFVFRWIEDRAQTKIY